MRKFLLALAFVAVSSFTERFDGHKVLRVVPKDAAEVEAVRLLETMTNSPGDLNWWQNPRAPGLPIDVRVSPSFHQDAMNYLHSKRIRPTVHIEDVQAHFEDARRVGDGTWDTAYHPYDQSGGIVDWLQAAAKANPSFVTLFTLGRTNLNRTIYGLIITKDTTKQTPVVYIDGAIHAREWLTPATMMYIIAQFVNHSTDATVNRAITSYTWYIVPVWNADGYNYTWVTNPEWRKNRQNNPGSTCVGTDCNRNCDAGWSNVGASSDPCSDEYHGTAPWSATETAVWRDFMTSLAAQRKVIAYVNFHSNAEMWLDPYGYTARLPADYNAQQANAKNVTAVIHSVNNATYAYGPIYTTIYPASGGTVDWTYDSLKIVLSQACELRGNSFQPSPTLIVPVGQEILAGVIQLADNAAKLYFSNI
jgi:murein tripeptide amidase MpaA